MSEGSDLATEPSEDEAGESTNETDVVEDDQGPELQDDDSSSEEEETEELTYDEAKQALCSALDKVEAAGSFATYGPLIYLIDPHLAVEFAGVISLPLI